ncbi:hypothetical protein JCM16303_002031 [Sporobolomyces ruberrimus]
MSTPLRSRHSSSSLSGTPTPAGKGRGSGLGRVPGTPLGRVLAAEGLAVRSPRKIRHRSLPDKAKDWLSNRILSLETSIQLFSFDSAGYPLACSFNLLHLLIRLPHFYSALPPLSSLWSSSAGVEASKYARQAAARQLDADARLAELQGSGGGRAFFGSGWVGWTLSVALILVSVANTAYLASRRRKYQLMLRKDPLSSPNAKAATLRFTDESTRTKKSLFSKVKAYVWSKATLRSSEPEPHTFPIQELHVWTPEYVLWSLRFFTGYPPPIALMYHFLSPSTIIPFLIIGPSLVFILFSLVHLYSTLIKDRQILSTETMHEYNSTFVYPRVFVQKRDSGVSTEELEFNDWKKERIYETKKSRQSVGGTGIEGGIGGEGGSESRSATPSRRRKRHTEF